VMLHPYGRVRAANHDHPGPRDTYINSIGFGPSRPTALYAYGGHEAASRSFRSCWADDWPHLIIKLGAIRRMGGRAGRREVDVPQRM